MKTNFKNIYSWFWILLLISSGAGAQVVQDPTKQYLKIAAENNPELKSIFNQYLATLERMPQVKALPDPTVMFNFFASPVETRLGAQNAGISLSQAFPWFGQLKSQENAVAHLAKAHYEAFENAKNKLFFNVRSEYFDLYVLEAAIGITKENIKILESYRELANVRLEAATGSAIDLLRVLMDLDELKNQLLYLEDSRLPIQTRFREMLNTDTPLDVVTPDTLLTISFLEGKSVLLDSIAAQNPVLRGFDYELMSLEAEIDVAPKMSQPNSNPVIKMPK